MPIFTYNHLYQDSIEDIQYTFCALFDVLRALDGICGTNVLEMYLSFLFLKLQQHVHNICLALRIHIQIWIVFLVN